MEQIGHTQWTLGLFLILAWTFQIQFTAFEFFFLGFMAHLPDLIDLLWGKQGFLKYHRFVTHSVFFIGFWLILALLTEVKLIWVIFVGSTLHIAEDILAGGGYIELFSPVTRKHGRILLVTRTTQERIGRIVKKHFSKYFLGTGSLSDDLAFFWLITMIGSWFFLIGVGLVLLR